MLDQAIRHARSWFIGRVMLPNKQLFLKDIAPAIDTISAAGFPQGVKQIDRLLDLKSILAERRPAHICEMGSGFSTVIFAQYAAKYGARLDTLEENPQWAEITQKALQAAGVGSHAPLLSSKVEEAPSVYYSTAINPACDFVYIDGPTAELSDGRVAVCSDTIRAWEAGIFPRTIAFDGRYATVRAMADHPAAKKYNWQYAWRFAIQEEQNRSLPHRLGRHTLARLH